MLYIAWPKKAINTCCSAFALSPCLQLALDGCCILLGIFTSLQLMPADKVVQACFKTLMALLHTRHGSIRELSAVVLRQMTANILGLADSSGPATKAVPTSAHPKRIIAVRLQALKFVRDVARCSISTPHGRLCACLSMQNPVGPETNGKSHVANQAMPDVLLMMLP